MDSGALAQLHRSGAKAIRSLVRARRERDDGRMSRPVDVVIKNSQMNDPPGVAARVGFGHDAHASAEAMERASCETAAFYRLPRGLSGTAGDEERPVPVVDGDDLACEPNIVSWLSGNGDRPRACEDEQQGKRANPVGFHQ